MLSRTYASPRVSKALVCLLLLLSALVLHAQTFRGGVNGTITDQSGAVVAGAIVSLVNNATSVTYNGVSSSGGEFLFQELPLGKYTTSVSAAGGQPEKVD